MSAVTDQQAFDAPCRSQTERLRALAAIHGDISALDVLEEWWSAAPSQEHHAADGGKPRRPAQRVTV